MIFCCHGVLFQEMFLCYIFPEYFKYFTYFTPGPNVSIIAHISQYCTLYSTAPVCRCTVARTRRPMTLTECSSDSLNINRRPCPRVRPRGQITQQARGEIFKLSRAGGTLPAGTWGDIQAVIAAVLSPSLGPVGPA